MSLISTEFGRDASSFRGTTGGGGDAAAIGSAGSKCHTGSVGVRSTLIVDSSKGTLVRNGLDFARVIWLAYR